jgi:hypothetical protein
VLIAALWAAAPAVASHGGSGSGSGGGGGTPTPTPSAAAATISPSSLSFATQDVGSTSAPQTITITDTGTAPLFFNAVLQGGQDPLDFNLPDDQCVGTTIAPGTSCTLTAVFNPTATGSRIATITVADNAANSPQTITLTGTGTSTSGPTPLSIDTIGSTCANGVCDLGSSFIVNNFLYRTFSASGDTQPPFTWAVVGGALPPGTALSPDGALTGRPTATGTSTFTLQVTDPNGQTATQTFSLTVSPVPPAGDPACQKAPGEPSALSGPAIGGRQPSGTANIDTSHFTACGGFYTITVSVKDVNLPDGTVLWVTLSGTPLGTIALHSGAGSIPPYVWPGELRKMQIQIFNQPPPFGPLVQPIMTGGQLT